MAETIIKCPNCGTEIPVSKALAEQLRGEMEKTLRADYERNLEQAVSSARTKARAETELELRDLREQLLERNAQVKVAQEAELELRKKARALEERQRDLDLELQRRLDAGRRAIEEQVQTRLDAQHGLKLKEKEKQINDLQQALEEARRKSQQGSQQTQGEILELDIESVLKARFPHDGFSSVPTGRRGADLVQEVRNEEFVVCGRIIWEVKNTKHWSPSWIQKLKDDQRAESAALAVIVSVAVPEGVRGFGQVDGVWVASLEMYPALAAALRQQLIQVAFAHNAQLGKNEKVEMLYQYFAGDEFRHRVEAIVEAFTSMKGQLDKERRAMERLWREREKQIERITTSTVGMYGELRGIIGGTLPEIPALELGDRPMLEDGSD